jgi:uncharacterized repeat protein (TIGR04138 family)
MRKTAYMEIVKQIREQDPRYDIEAYFFIREALDYTGKMLNKPGQGKSRHVSGRELLEGIRKYGLEEFGPIALKVFESWGITTTEDFGNIVFNLVNIGELGKTEEDTIEDFKNGYDFRDTFEKPFLSKTPPADDETEMSKQNGKRS